MSRSGQVSSTPSVQIFDSNTMRHALKESLIEDSDRRTPRLRALKKMGIDRTLACVTRESIDHVESLRESFPNFSEVIDFIREEMILSYMSRNTTLQLPPIALGGSAGVGKTQFCKALAQALKVESEFISCSTNNSEFAIAGMDSGYRSSYPGKLAEFFSLHDCANPIIVLDEFEKPLYKHNGSDQSFHGPFYTLLERASAGSFEDNFLKVRLNASYINWIVTVNDFERLPDPIQSRLHYFTIRTPTPEECRKICQSIYKGLRLEYSKEKGLKFRTLLNPAVLDGFTGLSPREMRKAIQHAMARAVTEQYRQRGSKDDALTTLFELAPSHLASRATTPTEPETRRGIGFMAAW